MSQSSFRHQKKHQNCRAQHHSEAIVKRGILISPPYSRRVAATYCALCFVFTRRYHCHAHCRVISTINLVQLFTVCNPRCDKATSKYLVVSRLLSFLVLLGELSRRRIIATKRDNGEICQCQLTTSIRDRKRGSEKGE